MALLIPDDEMNSVDEQVVVNQTADTSQPGSSQTSYARVPHDNYHFDIVHFAVCSCAYHSHSSSRLTKILVCSIFFP
jgi:hypothetical protein